MTKVLLMHGASPEQLGMLPFWIDDGDPRPAREQFDEHYQHGGGWRPFEGFKLINPLEIQYPGDEPLEVIALMRLRDEMIAVFPHDWVLILQKDGTFEVCRMD